MRVVVFEGVHAHLKRKLNRLVLLSRQHCERDLKQYVIYYVKPLKQRLESANYLARPVFSVCVSLVCLFVCLFVFSLVHLSESESSITRYCAAKIVPVISSTMSI